MRRLFRQFSTPGGIPRHVGVPMPGSIHEGGELGYLLTHAFGAAFDNPDLLVVAVVGDGEADADAGIGAVLDAPLRAEICAGLGHLGVRLDEARDAAGAEVVSGADASCVVRVVATDEERMIARHVCALLASRESGREPGGDRDG
jgi:hypothetical protein